MISETAKTTPKMRTINEIAAEFGLARHFVRQAVLQKRVVHVRAGKKYLLNRQSFAEWLETGEPTPQPETGIIRKLH